MQHWSLWHIPCLSGWGLLSQIPTKSVLHSFSPTLTRKHTGAGTQTHTHGGPTDRLGHDNYKIRHAHTHKQWFYLLFPRTLYPVSLLLAGIVRITSWTLHLRNERTKLLLKRGEKIGHTLCLFGNCLSKCLLILCKKVKKLMIRFAKLNKWVKVCENWLIQCFRSERMYRTHLLYTHSHTHTLTYLLTYPCCSVIWYKTTESAKCSKQSAPSDLSSPSVFSYHLFALSNVLMKPNHSP